MSAAPEQPSTTLGAILAGGASRRFGAPKALARVAGEPIVGRARRALGAAAPEVVLIANDPALFAELELPARGDAIPGGGPLSGIHAALRWAAERGHAGALCVACDMPFLSAGLLREVARRAARGEARAVAPESGSRLGLEPLCAWYAVECLDVVEARLARGERAAGALLTALRTERVPLATVRGYGDPDVLFLNVNTRDELRRAERLAAAREVPDEHP